MRRANKAITDRGTIEGLLHTCSVGRLGTIGPDGWPMVKPVNFAYHADGIYFHTAREGEKIDHIRRDDRVCFEVDLPIAYVKGSPGRPCTADCLYRSAIIKGRARLIDDPEERIAALLALLRKYQPGVSWSSFPADKLAVTGVVRVEIEEMVGKEDLGKEHHRSAVLGALERGEPRLLSLEP